jgi:hypothetical protein
MAIQLVEGKKFYVADGDIRYTVTVRRNSLPYYKWSMETGPDWLESEVWADDGTAYHADCGNSIVGEINITWAVDAIQPDRNVIHFPIVEGSPYRTGGAWRMHEAEAKAAYADFITYLESNREKLHYVSWWSRSSNKFSKLCFPTVCDKSDSHAYEVSDGVVKMSAMTTDGRGMDYFACEFESNTRAFEEFIKVKIEDISWHDLPMFVVGLK